MGGDVVCREINKGGDVRWWKVALGVFLSVGVMVAMISFYEISLSSSMKKLGLVDADFAGAVSREKLTEWGIAAKAGWECGMPNRVKGVVEFLLSGDSEQGQLSFRLGEMRVRCGAGMMREGEVETGTYEVTKGLGYLREGYKYLGERGGVDLRVCEGLPSAEVEKTIAGLLSGTSGKIYELLRDEWGKVVILQEQAAELCLDERESRR